MNNDAKIKEAQKGILEAVAKSPHSVLVGEKHTTAKVTLQGIVSHEELQSLMSLGEVNIVRSGSGVGVSVKIPHKDGE